MDVVKKNMKLDGLRGGECRWLAAAATEGNSPKEEEKEEEEESDHWNNFRSNPAIS